MAWPSARGTAELRQRQLQATGRAAGTHDRATGGPRTRVGVPASDDATAPGRFARLLAALHRQTGDRVVLVDESVNRSWKPGALH